MARVVYITNGMASTLNSSFEFSRRLVKSGHEVIYCSHAALSSAVEPKGYHFVQLQACQRIQERWREEFQPKKRSISQWPSALTTSLRFRRQSLVSTEIEDQVRQLEPAVLIIDIEMHYAILATMHLHIPTVLPIVWFSIFRSRGLPPLHTRLQPATSFGQRMQIEWAWSKLLLRRAMQIAIPKPTPNRWKQNIVPVSYATNRRKDLKALARARGINFRSVTDWTQWLIPHLYPKLQVLSFNAWEMEFPHNPHPSITYVGPMVQKDRGETLVTKAALDEWRTFRRRCLSDGQRIVYCSLGTYWSPKKDLLRSIVRVFEKRPDWALVIGLGGKARSDELTSKSQNVLIMDYAPQMEILQSASAAITHGGITTINECIYCEVPMLVCSTGHVDQHGCAARVDYHELGRVLRIDRAKPTSLESQVEDVLSSEQIRSKIRDMKAAFTRYEQTRVAEKTIEQLIDTHFRAAST